MKKIHMITFILLAIGGINWLLFALLPSWEIGNLLGGGSIAKIIYILVGVSAILEILAHKARCKQCGIGGRNQVNSSVGGGQM